MVEQLLNEVFRIPGLISSGSVFRVSPNELSFASVKSWKAIYGPWPGASPFLKTEFYEMYGSGFDSRCIGSERDPAQHNRMKRSLAGGFSNKALLEQEEIVQGCVDKFIEKIADAAAGPQGLNMTDWYEMLAFDVLGEMAFGESFHCIDDGPSFQSFPPFASVCSRTGSSHHRETALLATDDL